MELGLSIFLQAKDIFSMTFSILDKKYLKLIFIYLDNFYKLMASYNVGNSSI